MKYDYIQRIVEKIEKDIRCPSCGARFSKEIVEVSEAGPGYIDFVVPCPACNARVSVSADIQMILPIIEIPKSTKKIPLSNESRKHRSLSSQDITKIKKALDSFQGEDIRDLFS